MTPIRFFTDEDVYGQLAPQVRNHGLDAVSTPEVQRLGEADESQLRWASNEGRVIVSFNVGDFGSLHHDWLTTGGHHAGIVVSQRRPIGEMLRRLLNLARSLSAESMSDRFEYLGQWPPV